MWDNIKTDTYQYEPQYIPNSSFEAVKLCNKLWSLCSFVCSSVDFKEPIVDLVSNYFQQKQFQLSEIIRWEMNIFWLFSKGKLSMNESKIRLHSSHKTHLIVSWFIKNWSRLACKTQSLYFKKSTIPKWNSHFLLVCWYHLHLRQEGRGKQRFFKWQNRIKINFNSIVRRKSTATTTIQAAVAANSTDSKSKAFFLISNKHWFNVQLII